MIQRLGLNSLTSEPQTAGSKCKPLMLTETQVFGGITVSTPFKVNASDLSAVYLGSKGMAENSRCVSYCEQLDHSPCEWAKNIYHESKRPDEPGEGVVVIFQFISTLNGIDFVTDPLLYLGIDC